MAAQLQIFQAGAPQKRVVSQVENVIGLVIGEVDFEQVQLIVDGLNEADASGQEVEGADAAVGDAAVAVGDFVMDVGGREDGLVDVVELGLVEPSVNPTLAAFQLSSYLGIHSKLLVSAL